MTNFIIELCLLLYFLSMTHTHLGLSICQPLTSGNMLDKASGRELTNRTKNQCSEHLEKKTNLI